MRMNKFKNFLILFVLITASTSQLSSQKIYFWLDAGLKVSAGAGLLYNNNLINDRNITPIFASTYGIGGKFGFNFGEFHAITIDAMYSLSAQRNELKSDNIDLVNKRIAYNSADFYFMYRYNRNLNYVELGAKYGLYQRFTQTLNGANTEIVDDQFVDNMISPVLGFGYYMFNADAFTANLGFRLSYGLYDILNATGVENDFYIAPLTYDDYAPTNPAFIEVVLELNFGLGQYAKSVCGKRASFMSI